MTTLIERSNLAANSKAALQYNQFAALLRALEEKNLPENITKFIHEEVQLVNAIADDTKGFTGAIKAAETKVVRQVEKQLKIVPKNYYRKLWLVLGMSSFGIPFGVVFGMSIGNIALLGTGLPIGMGIGVLIGTKLDNKAYQEGRQLNIELKH
jgi:hypothetical protein